VGLDNSVNITGRLTKDVELKMTQKSTPVTSFTLAVKRGFSKNGDVDFVNCVAWSHSANYLAKYASKGDLVSIDGELRSRTFNKDDGSTVFITEVNCNQVAIRNKAGGAEHNEDEAKTEAELKLQPKRQPKQSDHELEETEVYVRGDTITDDDVPF
jgi:single-strand DNA-binding protein